jgi:hypothetical protein
VNRNSSAKVHALFDPSLIAARYSTSSEHSEQSQSHPSSLERVIRLRISGGQLRRSTEVAGYAAKLVIETSARFTSNRVRKPLPLWSGSPLVSTAGNIESKTARVQVAVADVLNCVLCNRSLRHRDSEGETV